MLNAAAAAVRLSAGAALRMLHPLPSWVPASFALFIPNSIGALSQRATPKRTFPKNSFARAKSSQNRAMLVLEAVPEHRSLQGPRRAPTAAVCVHTACGSNDTQRVAAAERSGLFKVRRDCGTDSFGASQIVEFA